MRKLLKNTPLAPLLRPMVRAWSKWRADQKSRSDFWHFDATDEARLRFYKQFVRPGDLVFDVGANMGNRAKVFLKLGARVVAFEPQPRCAEYLETVFHGRDDFSLEKVALGALDSCVDMHVSDSHVLSSLNPTWIKATVESGRFAAVHWDQTIRVPVTTIDAAIARFGVPSFVKIDVEGSERAVISGLSLAIPALSFEFTAEMILEAIECVECLERLGDILGQVSYGESMDFALSEWVRPHALKTILRNIEGLSAGDVYIRTT